MRIRSLTISNFRGIRELHWSLPDKPLYCLIGPGDSTKSTILEALRRACYPHWSLSFCDADFYDCDTTTPLTIDVVLGDLPDTFRDLANYGDRLSGWDAVKATRTSDPGEGLEDVLLMRLSVAEDLEPKWTVVKDGFEQGIPFKAADRAKIGVTMIGATADRNLTWSRGSLLTQHTQSDNIAAALAIAGRAAKAALDGRRKDDLVQFDEVARRAETTARSLGVRVNSGFKSGLDMEAVNIGVGGLALHDGNVPMRQAGLGSRRMLTTGLQKDALSAPHVTLCDEVEFGLEPHRITRLLQHLKDDVAGQYFLTTHSPVVLRELTVDDLYVVRSVNGNTHVSHANIAGLASQIQGKIRSGAETFLASRIIVCEGATEVGFLRGMDEHWSRSTFPSFAYQGVAMFDAGGGSKVCGVAESLHALSFPTAVLADLDRPDQFSADDMKNLQALGICIAVWKAALSIEGRVFMDVPWQAVIASFNLASEFHGVDRTMNQVASQYGAGFPRNTDLWVDNDIFRTALAKAAHGSEWFKRQDRARDWALAIAPTLDAPDMRTTDICTQLGVLRAWIDRAAD